MLSLVIHLLQQIQGMISGHSHCQAFIKNPLLGQGFGGWEHEYMKYSSYFLLLITLLFIYGLSQVLLHPFWE
jgi:hypothetical protein